LEIPDDVVNFFNNRQSSAMPRSSDDEGDVGLLHLDSEAEDEVPRPTTDGHKDSGITIRYFTTYSPSVDNQDNGSL